MKIKNKKPLVIISLLILVAIIISISIIFYTRETKDKKFYNVDQNVSTEKYELDDEEQKVNNENKENVGVTKELEEKIEDSKNDNSVSTKENKTTTTTTPNQGSVNKSKKNNSENINTEQNNPKTNANTQNETKKLTKKEIEDYVRKTISDFRYDFDSIKECENEGNKWMEYGWTYNCTYGSVPDSDVVPTMLTITTGKLFCDGAFTKNEEYDYRKPKISNLKYLRSIGYPCANIEDN